ncbi:hypothetical protein M758_5G114800 [Ceratodon purpureus]|nr:hypothetical protein M758_5G114800 [Ceratodon purpureus]
MSNHQTEIGIKLMEAARSSRSSSTERDEIDYDTKVLRDVDPVDTTTSADLQSSAKGESSVQHQANSCPEENPESKSEAAGSADDDMATKLRRKIYEAGLGDVRVPDLHSMSGCSDCEETESDDDDDDDLCSDSSDDNEESSYNPLASGVMPPVLPDIQLRVPMEDENEVQRVKNALLIKGVLEVSCDEERQIVTVTGVVPPSRLLKKVRKVNRQARIVSTVSPFAVFINPHFRASAFTLQEESDAPRSTAVDIPSPHPVPNFVVHQQRPRPAFQRYTFHNDPHSPYLRTFSPSDLSPKDSPSHTTGDAYDHHRWNDSSFLDDDLFMDNGVMST